MYLMLSICCLVALADQTAKAIVAARLEEGKFTSGTIGGIRLRHVINRRNPWGSRAGVRMMTLAWVGLAISAWVVASRVDEPSARVAIGGLMGGATGNLIDGLSRNAVTDFIDLRVWPVFNLADAAIVAGATLLLWNASSIVRAFST